MWFGDKIGFGVMIVAGSIIQAVASCIRIAKPPFPVMALSYLINGFGEALNDAQANGMVATLPTNANAQMSLLHSVYGMGAFASPLVATQFAQMEHWSYNFMTTLALSMIALASSIWVFRFRHHAGSVIRLILEDDES